MRNEKYFYDYYKKFEYNHDDTLLYKYIYISMYMCESNFWVLFKLNTTYVCKLRNYIYFVLQSYFSYV